MDKEIFKNKLWEIIGDKKELPIMCYCCGEDDPRILKKLEKHHYFGKINSEETTLLCPNCHAKVTAKQNSVPPNKRTKNKIAFQLITQGALLEIFGKEQIKLAKRIYKNGSSN